MTNFYDYLKNEMASQRVIEISRGNGSFAMDCGGRCSYSSSSSNEVSHPRKKKGEKGGGQFTKKPSTLKEEDDRDILDKGSEGDDASIKMTMYQLESDHKLYKKRGSQLKKALGSLHGVDFTSLAKQISMLRKNMRNSIMKLESLGYECEGDLENGFTLKGRGSSAKRNCNRSSQAMKSCQPIARIPVSFPFSGTGRTSGGGCWGRCF